MTERQQTGVWFIVAGVLLLSIWIFAYAIVNYAIDSAFISASMKNLSDEQSYMVGISAVVTLQLASLTGVPLIVAGLAQIAAGAKKSKKSSKK